MGLNPMGSKFSIPPVSNLCSESVEASSFEILLKDSKTSSKFSVTVRVECLLLFNFGIVNSVSKTNEGEAESIIMSTFVWERFNRQSMRGGGMEQ